MKKVSIMSFGMHRRSTIRKINSDKKTQINVLHNEI